MDKFTVHTGIAAPLPIVNIDTDMIIPKQFLTTVKRTGLGANLFDELRFNEDGSEIEEFVLNKADYRNASILVAGANFGCGSSREHAPWALLDFGICCVIASSFADIFYNNCFKNGILPIKLDEQAVSELMDEAEAGRKITVDLEAQEVRTEHGKVYSFEVDEWRRHCLLNGLDDVGLTLQKEDKIIAYEEENIYRKKPWL